MAETHVPVDAVVTHHKDGFRSGVARFNELLSQQLRVPLLTLDDLATAAPACPLLSFKVRELGPDDAVELDGLLETRTWSWELFLHEYADLSLERRLVVGAQRVHCGNLEIETAVAKLTTAHDTLWTPGLIVDERPFRPSEISVFSFGMAHKIRTDMFRRLKELLDASGRSYAVYVSAANHETASLRDAEVVFGEMNEVFGDSLFFLGNLSDVVIAHYLVRSTFFAAFFPNGVRGNNTSVAAAMEHGAVVITNLDAYSPPEYVHMENLLDFGQCAVLPTDARVLEQLSGRAKETARSRSWPALVQRLTATIEAR